MIARCLRIQKLIGVTAGFLLASGPFRLGASLRSSNALGQALESLDTGRC